MRIMKTTQELIAIVRELKTTYLAIDNGASFADLADQWHKVTLATSPTEQASILQAFDAWIEQREAKPQLTLIK